MKQSVLAFIFSAFFLVYVILLLLDFHLMPTVWFDEVMGLDPSVNAVFGDGFKSRIWPQEGTEERFMAYMPLRFWVHRIVLSIVPFTVFWVRLPWIIFGLTAFALFYFAIKRESLNWFLAAVFTLILMNDRVIFETLRSMRVDALAYLVLATVLFFWSRKQVLGIALSSCLLVLVHPNLWWIAFCFYSYALIKAFINTEPRVKASKRVLVLLSPVLTGIALLFYINFDIAMFMSQLLEHGRMHQMQGGFFQRFSDHFISRFWPYYNRQPWTPIIIYTALAYAVYRLIKKDFNTLFIALTGTHIYWLLFLAPYYRYNGVLIFISIIVLIHWLRSWDRTFILHPVLLILLIAISSVEVGVRHIIALSQYSERNPKPAISWVENEMNKAEGTVLMFGHDLAFYPCAIAPFADYMLFNTSPEKFEFDQYNHHWYLSSEKMDFVGVNLFSEYHIRSNELGDLLYDKFDLQTYRNMYLYEVETKPSYLQLLDRLNADNKTTASEYHQSSE
ncbi:glycosyltransferase family 39 protein [bacterium]|nr:glycosyltransferase family 39 protein [bacterium]